MKIAAEADLLDLEFAGAEFFGRTGNGVILRMVCGLQIIRVESNFGREQFRVEYRRTFAAGSVHPANVADISPWGDGVVCGRRLGSLESLRYRWGGSCRSLTRKRGGGVRPADDNVASSSFARGDLQGRRGCVRRAIRLHGHRP